MTFIALLPCRFFSSVFIRKNLLFISAGSLFMCRKNNVNSSGMMEVVKVPPIVSVYRHAVHTFDVNSKKDLAKNVSQLKNMMNELKPEHLGFDKTLNDPKTWALAGKAPCTYIQVFQDNQINMSIFVLKPGFQMPLHDHPHMHGLLKVISGVIKIKSFSEYPLKEAIKMVDFIGKAKLEAARLAQGLHQRRRFFCEITQDQICSSASPTCVLTPTISNYHEIQAMDAPAAFFDILSPPYDTFIQGIGPRRCHYYHIINQISTNVVELQETDVPECFYCDQAPYLGPILS